VSGDGRGFTWRTIDPEADLDVAVALVTRSEREAVGWTEATRDSVRWMLTSPIAAREEHRLLLDAGAPVGLLVMEVDAPAREVFVDAFGIGGERGRVLTLLVEHGLEVARRAAANDPTPVATGVDPYVVSAAIWQAVCGQKPEDAVHGEVLAAAGFRAVRRFWRMSLDLTGRSTVEPDAPSGVTVRPAAGEADLRIIHALEQDSFSEHFGSGSAQEYERWIADMEARPGHDPDRWWMASLDGEPVGFCILDHSHAEFGRDHVRLLGVVRRARGRGIGRWLLERAAAQAAGRGQTALVLSVDGENTTGATALYESVGFVTQHVVDAWCHPLAEG
jgi:mycothiol synthase